MANGADDAIELPGRKEYIKNAFYVAEYVFLV